MHLPSLMIAHLPIIAFGEWEYSIPSCESVQYLDEVVVTLWLRGATGPMWSAAGLGGSTESFPAG